MKAILFHFCLILFLTPSWGQILEVNGKTIKLVDSIDDIIPFDNGEVLRVRFNPESDDAGYDYWIIALTHSDQLGVLVLDCENRNLKNYKQKKIKVKKFPKIQLKAQPQKRERRRRDKKILGKKIPSIRNGKSNSKDPECTGTLILHTRDIKSVNRILLKIHEKYEDGSNDKFYEVEFRPNSS